MNKSGTAILILAAGGASRLGRPKQLLPIGHTTLLNHIIDVSNHCGIDLCYTVLGAYYDEVETSICHSKTNIIKNKRWQLGISTSIVSGIQHIIDTVPYINQVIVLLGDQPLLKADDILNLIGNQVATNADIVYTDYGNNFGPPILFTKKTFPSLLRLKGDEGAKKIIKTGRYSTSCIHVKDIEADINTIDDYNGIIKFLS